MQTASVGGGGGGRGGIVVSVVHVTKFQHVHGGTSTSTAVVRP